LRRLVPHRRPRRARSRRLPAARRPPQGDDPPRRREHLAVRDRGGAARAPGRRRRDRLRHRRREVRRAGRCSGDADGGGGAARADRPLPRAARRVQGARGRPRPRRDSADADGQGAAEARGRVALRARRVKFAILGAGAIGAYVGAALTRGGADVTLIARGEHLRAMQQDGVRVLSSRGDFEAHPAATDDIDAVADAEVVFVGLKAHSLPGIAPALGRALRPDAALIAAQNGLPWWYFQSHPGPFENEVLESVDPGGIVTRSIPPETVVGCVIYCSTEIVAPGVIRHIEGTRFPIGEPDGSQTDRCRRISEAFAAGGLRCPVEGRIRDHIWLKLIGNAAFNPVTALTGATLGELGTLPEMVDLLRAVLTECAE